jgi:nucleotide-binding universal stress UspA family protein
MPVAGASIAIRNILFPTDFSKESEQAIACAQSIAHGFQARVHVANVVDLFPHTLSDTPEAREKQVELRRQSEARLKDFMLAHQLDPRHFAPVVLAGEIFLAVEEYARRQEIDLIILGSRGDVGFERLFQGSVAEEIFRTAHCPVLVAGPEVREVGIDGLFNRILYATDRSAVSRAALPHLEFLLASNPKSTVALAHFMATKDAAMFQRHQERRQLEKELRSLLAPSLQHQITDVIVEPASPGPAIAEAAAQLPADLVVLGVRYGGAFVRAATHGCGSLASQVIQQVTCPVLTVRSSQEQ